MSNAPSRILDVESAFRHRADRPRSYRFSGCAGDVHHSFGYHVGPAWLPSWDYSLDLKRDREGGHDHPHDASAWDQSYNPHDMEMVTNRLLAAAKKRDPRMAAVREFCGTRDGHNTYPWDCHSNSSEGINSWDSSHLWHVHVSFYRDASEKQIGLLNDVLCGKKMGPIHKVISVGSTVKHAVGKPKFPLPAGHVFGPRSGPVRVHGGASPSERANVRRVQLALIKDGCVPGVKAGTARANSWADGIWEGPTSEAMRRWQHKHHRDATGVCGPADWKALV